MRGACSPFTVCKSRIALAIAARSVVTVANYTLVIWMFFADIVPFLCPCVT